MLWRAPRQPHRRWVRRRLHAERTQPREGGVYPNRLDDPTCRRQLVTNNELTCAVLADASVWCWGTNRLGVLSPRGVNDPHVYQTANRIEAVSSFAVKSMALSAGRACAIAPAGSSERQLVCWGDDRFVRTANSAEREVTNDRASSASHPLRSLRRSSRTFSLAG